MEVIRPRQDCMPATAGTRTLMVQVHGTHLRAYMRIIVLQQPTPAGGKLA